VIIFRRKINEGDTVKIIRDDSTTKRYLHRSGVVEMKNPNYWMPGMMFCTYHVRFSDAPNDFEFFNRGDLKLVKRKEEYLLWLYENNKCAFEVKAYIVENLDVIKGQIAYAKKKGIRP
jgi:hypothetical protein